MSESSPKRNPRRYDKMAGSKADSRYQREMDAFERRLIGEALRENGGVQTKTALALGITFRMLRYRIQQLDMRADAEPSTHQQKLDDAERRLIHRMLREHGGDAQAAADALGIPVESLQYRVERLNVLLESPKRLR